MPLLAAGEYRPDVSDYLGTASRNVLNVIPRGDGYGAPTTPTPIKPLEKGR